MQESKPTDIEICVATLLSSARRGLDGAIFALGTLGNKLGIHNTDVIQFLSAAAKNRNRDAIFALGEIGAQTSAKDHIIVPLLTEIINGENQDYFMCALQALVKIAQGQHVVPFVFLLSKMVRNKKKSADDCIEIIEIIEILGAIKGRKYATPFISWLCEIAQDEKQDEFLRIKVLHTVKTVIAQTDKLQTPPILLKIVQNEETSVRVRLAALRTMKIVEQEKYIPWLQEIAQGTGQFLVNWYEVLDILKTIAMQSPTQTTSAVSVLLELTQDAKQHCSYTIEILKMLSEIEQGKHVMPFIPWLCKIIQNEEKTIREKIAALQVLEKIKQDEHVIPFIPLLRETVQDEKQSDYLRTDALHVLKNMALQSNVQPSPAVLALLEIAQDKTQTDYIRLKTLKMLTEVEQGKHISTFIPWLLKIIPTTQNLEHYSVLAEILASVDTDSKQLRRSSSDFFPSKGGNHTPVASSTGGPAIGLQPSY